MKSDETLAKLAKNPHYVMSDEEKERVQNILTAPKAEEDVTKKKVTGTLGNAAVKETGKFEKHSTDPISE